MRVAHQGQPVVALPTGGYVAASNVASPAIERTEERRFLSRPSGSSPTFLEKLFGLR